MRHLSVLGIFFVFFTGLSTAQVNDKNFKTANIPQAFWQLNVSPQRLFFENVGIDVYTNGGHLQGIQYYSNAGVEYAVFSGSSNKQAYYAMVDINKARLVRYNVIDSSPYDHAGGFQIIGDFLVVGVEDNASKNASKIVFYDLSKPGESDIMPIHSILRGKAFKTKTAGALGITHYKGRHLMAVVSWDAATVDFYESNGMPISDSAFEMRCVSTWLANPENINDGLYWKSYQGISLFTGADEKLYLFAFARKGFQNVVDGYEVTSVNNMYLFTKIATKVFHTGKNSFRYGAGMHVTAKGELFLYSTPYRLGKKNFITQFGPASTN